MTWTTKPALDELIDLQDTQMNVTDIVHSWQSGENENYGLYFRLTEATMKLWFTQSEAIGVGILLDFIEESNIQDLHIFQALFYLY